MMRIVALNEEEQDESESEDEIAVTKEAQEAIAESEYMRAMKLKAQGKPDITLSLLTELLETKVLNEILIGDKNEKLWSIRYNCHRNIAIISEEKGDYQKALQHFIKAMEIDDTDVYTLNRFGRLALKENALGLAECAFDKCLQRNPLHYGAADSKLEILCRNQNILGAYGWALKLYRRDPYHKHAERTLREISTIFKGSLPFFAQIWGPAPSEITNREWNREKDGSVFPETNDLISTDETLKEEFPKDIEQFRFKNPTWITVGRYILDVYRHLEKTSQSMLFAWNFNDILCDSANGNEGSEKMVVDLDRTETVNENSNNSNSNLTEMAATAFENCSALQREAKYDNELYSQSPQPSIFATPPLTTSAEPNSGEKTPNHETNSDQNEDSKSDGSDVSKPKPRRRCSDLHFLEQWGWHKNRRYSSRKKSLPDRPEVDSSLNGFLRKIYAQFMSPSFENEWPFLETSEIKSENPEIKDELIDCLECKDCKEETTMEAFQMLTQKNFETFLEKLKAKRFDLMVLIYKWLKYISISWETHLPNDLKTLYQDIFELYLRHFDFTSWNLLNENNYVASYRICLLYLELNLSKNIEGKSELSVNWRNIYDQLLFKSGTVYVILNENFDPFKLRLAYLEYLWCRSRSEYEKCVNCLQHMEEIVNKKSEDFMLHLPNLQEDCMTRKFITITRSNLQRQISLITVPTLFKQEKWKNLIEIIQENISHLKNNYKCENWIKDMKVQIEILLQAYWSLRAYEDCLVWAEKFCHYCTCRYLQENKFSYRQKFWSESLNYIFSYIEALMLNEGFEIVSCLEENLSRLVQNIIRILAYQLDGPIDKNNNPVHELESKRLWVVLHQIVMREENNSPVVIKTKTNETDEYEEVIPNSFLLLFTAHEFLGKRQWCTNDNGGILQYILDSVTPNLRAPLYDVCRDAVFEYIEQVTFCLYGYPQKKARSRHLEDHEANTMDLTWPKAIQLFDLYRPESLPEFNSYKLESISADMEQLLVKILGLMPVELDPTPATAQILDFINGVSSQPPDDDTAFTLPFKVCTIFYLLGDYYFKSRDFSKAIKYYMLDLACSPTRFDSWAGIALSKASKIETKLNGLAEIELSLLMVECEETMRCFERCIALNRNQVLLWIEYGSFAYTMHAYCSRYLKQNADKLSLEEFSSAENRKENMLQIACNCFSLAATLQTAHAESAEDSGESHDEKWLCQYMLGKIAEKRKEQPKVFLNYYLTAANFLYENNATYPIKLNHSNPTTLSVEALEVFYRINSAIIKYLENSKEISREIGDLFAGVLRNLSNSPFAYNKAKIDGNSLNAFKRKIADKIEQQASPPKIPREATEPTDAAVAVEIPTTPAIVDNGQPKLDAANEILNNNGKLNAPEEKVKDDPPNKVDDGQSGVSPSRRESQESAATGTTTTVTSSTTSSASSTDSSSSDSDSDETETESKKDSNTPYSSNELKALYSLVVQNLEECITRFSEHYKSIYRLVYHYLNAPPDLIDLGKCEQLLISQYKTSLGNQINGLFFDRKNNNIFNGIWRIPSSEIDRPGSFSAHLVKCVGLLERVLLKTKNFQLLTDIGLQLYRTPDSDKRYINDHDRMELYRQSIIYSGQAMRSILKNHMEKRDDEEILNFLLDIYKAHKKCVKYINQRETVYVQLMVDVYKFFIQDKVEQMPETLNFYDLSVKLCIQELTARKNLEKSNNTSGSRPGSNTNISDVMLGISSEIKNPTLPPRPIHIPGLPMRYRQRNMQSNNKLPINQNFMSQVSGFDSTPIAASLSSIFGTDMLNSPNMMSMMSMLGTTPISQNTAEFQQMVRDFYKQILEGNNKNLPFPQNLPMPTHLTSIAPPTQSTNISLASSLPAETTITPSSLNVKNYRDIKTLPQTAISTSTANTQDILQTARISLGLTDLTILPARSASSTMTAETIKPSISATTAMNNANIFLQPISATDLPSNLNPLPQLPQYSNAPSIPTPTTKVQTKAKSSAKNKNIPQKPFERPTVSGSNIANPLTSMPELSQLTSLINSMSPEERTQFLSTYADLLKNSAFKQMPTPAQKNQRAAPKRKPKAQASLLLPTSKSSVPDVTAASAIYPPNVAQPSISSIQRQQPLHPVLSTSNPYHIPTFDPSVMTISPMPTSSVDNSKSGPSTLTTSSLSTATTMPNIFSQQANVSGSPTKTLQQKLAERQKANQLNEASTSATAARKPSIDVIILD